MEVKAAATDSVTFVPDSSSVPYQLRTPGEDFLQQFRQEAAFNYQEEVITQPEWLERLLKWINEHMFRINYSGKGEGLNIALKISAILLAIFLIYKLIHSWSFFLPARKSKPLEGVEELVGESLTPVSYTQLVTEAEQKGDFALAIRIHYWYILYLLDQQSRIHWEKNKTNQLYCYELKDELLKKDFRHLTWIFDCVCYGEFEVDARLYQESAKVFHHFRQRIGE